MDLKKFIVTVGATMLLGTGAAQAATMTVTDPTPEAGFVSSVTYEADNVVAGRGTANDRDDATNAFGAADGAFFEIGLNGYVDFHFDPSFISPGGVIEITFGDRGGFPEFATVKVGNKGDADEDFVAIDNNPISNENVTNIFTFAGGPFDTVRLSSADGTTVRQCGPSDARYDCGGFDVDAITVNAVPLPAAGWMLIAGLGGLGAMRRFRKS